MPINPAMIQQMPDYEYEQPGMSIGEGVLMGVANAIGGATDYAAQRDKIKQNQMMQVMPTLISEGLVSPTIPGTPGAVDYGGTPWRFSGSATGYKATERSQGIEKGRIAIKKGKAEVGEAPMSRPQIMKMAMNSPMYKEAALMASRPSYDGPSPTSILAQETERISKALAAPQTKAYLKSKTEQIKKYLQTQKRKGTQEEVNAVIEQWAYLYTPEQIEAALGGK